MPPKEDKNDTMRLKRYANEMDVMNKRLIQINESIKKFNPETEDEFFLQLKQEALVDVHFEYKRKAGDLFELLPEEDIAERQKQILDFEELLDDTNVLIKRFLSKYKKSEPPPNRNERNEGEPISRIRLPEIPLPTFAGNYNEWVYFREKFTALIIDNPSLDDVQKHHYLRSALRDEAATLQSSNDTLQSLWLALTKRYEMKRVIAEKHITELFNIKCMFRESASELRCLLDVVIKNIRVLETIELEQNQLSELFLINLVCGRLDGETRKAFEQQQNPEAFPTWKDTLKFLQQRCHVLESIEASKASMGKSSVIKNPSTTVPANRYTQKPPAGRLNTLTTSNKKPLQCPICQKRHITSQCIEFLNMSVKDRQNKVKTLNICNNCLSPRHATKDCSSSSCRRCNGQHHSLLHLDSSNDTSNGNNNNTNNNRGGNNNNNNNRGGNNNNNATGSHNLVTSLNKNQPPLTLVSTNQQVLLSTVVLIVYDTTGSPIQCRALLDSGSQSNFVTESLAQLIKMKRETVNLPIVGISRKTTLIKHQIAATIQSRTSTFSTELQFLVIPQITGTMPTTPLDSKAWNIPSNIQLADPQFYAPQRIDMLLGAEVFFDIWTSHQIRLQKGLPSLNETLFGWVLAGKLSAQHPSASNLSFCGCIAQQPDELSELVKKFWEIESCETKKRLNTEEQRVEQHFSETVSRQPDGRYVVQLPLKESVNDLGDSKKMAIKRFSYLERKLSRNENLKTDYTSFINEYLALGHMTPSPLHAQQQNNINYYMPHHAVLKPDSVTTKLRVVFDGSAASSSGLSLNNVMMIGPTVQQELFEIIIRFRKHRYAFTADICKMYRQINITESQHSLQQILWRPDPNSDIKAYSLRTVTYGTASAPYLATRALIQLARDEENNFPAASIVTQRDFYVDDILSGADTLEKAKEIQLQLAAMLKSGGFDLHKWVSNSPQLLNQLDSQYRVQLADNNSVKALGLTWQPTQDFFLISSGQEMMKDQAVTKRTVLSNIASLYDPLGLAGPIVVTAKLLLQRLWSKQMDWDQPIDEEDRILWVDFQSQLYTMEEIKVPRCVISKNPKSIKLLGFCDSSSLAYGACIYIHCLNDDNTRTTNLLCAKSRVAPLKATTIPRLELCSAVLLANLATKVHSAMQIDFDQTILWTDSTIVLSWIRSQSAQMKTFVANRIAEIHDLTSPTDWRHISSKENPADIVSRGLLPDQLQDTTLWWYGPTFINQDEDQWPRSYTPISQDCLPEMKPITALTVHHKDSLPVLTKFSSFSKLQRVIAYVLRFIDNCKGEHNKRRQQSQTAMELWSSLMCIVHIVQREEFGLEILAIQKKTPLDRKSKLYDLNVFIDNQQILRVGGRLRNSAQSFETKHQIVLPKQHYVTKLLIRSLHEDNGHIGQQALLAVVRQTYWPIGAKDLIRNITRSCVKCFKCNPKSSSQFMGDLPTHRSVIYHAFVNVGVDYAGPLTLKLNRRTSIKAYVAVFVCMSTKAVHIELVSELSTKAFIAALSRFVSRRGHCQNLYSDNATNFVGARNELAPLYELLEDSTHQQMVHNTLASKLMQFHFIPPRAPHFGGLWEAAVKSMKYHLVRIIGNTPLSFEEMATVLTKIEAILNSRPLVPESSDPEDNSAITPGHFLIGRPLTALIEPNYLDVATNSLRRWQLLQKLTQHFWQRWSVDYLTSLQRRAKTLGTTEFKLDMLVLLKDDNVPPTQWNLGRIVELHPGVDGLVRVVTVKTKTGLFKRPVVKVCILPSPDLDPATTTN
jgi:Pao retrotransposon peptidase/Family of unknown function (DUF5641)/Protein of unknown function (DUF1759)/Putative peptidase (DUF1758)/Integrase zinc binding domain